MNKNIVKRDPRKEFGKAATAVAREQDEIVVISTDSGGSSGFSDFKKDYPDRYYELGIMEQCATGVAAGLACVGKTPIFCAIAPFVTCRSYEMFRNDLGYMNQNVKIVGRNGGMTYSDLGATHYSLEDYGIISMIPDVVILAPQDPGEIAGATRAMLAHKGPVYMRIGNEPIPELWPETTFQIGKGTIIQEGTDITIISTGACTAKVMEAVSTLEAQGISVAVVGMPTVVPLDVALILDIAQKTKKILTVEEHYVLGGLGSQIANVCAAHTDATVHIHGLPMEYVTTGSYEDLLHHYQLDAEGIAAVATAFSKS